MVSTDTKKNGNVIALINAKVYLERDKFAQAVLIRENAIASVGENDDILALAGEGARVIDCGGRAALPGFNDAHIHLASYGMTMKQVYITDCDSEDELVRRCKAFIEENPEQCAKGLKGNGWNQDFFPSKRIPTRQILDRISTDIPIVLSRVCGHVVIANTKAIEMAGMSASTPQPPDGSFGVEEDGYPNGIFNENHSHLNGVIPDPSEAEIEAAFIRAMKYAVSRGLTSVQSNDARGPLENIDRFYNLARRLNDEGKLILRYRHQTCFKSPEDFKRSLEEGEYSKGKYGDGLLQLGPLKLFKDGGLGGRTCYMRQDFLDDPGNRGISTMTPETMDQYCRLADEHDVQVVTHVIGDLAADETLDAYEKILRNGENPLRHGLIHLQISDTPILERIARYGVTVFYQPVFLQYELHIVELRVGKELASTSYAFGQADRLGIHTAYSSDAPVEQCDPLQSVYCAVTRQDFKGDPPGGFAPHQKVDLFTAIDAFTLGSAYCEFEEERKGRIKPGWLADVVVFDRDIFAIEPKELLDTNVFMTIVDGKIVYEA